MPASSLWLCQSQGLCCLYDKLGISGGGGGVGRAAPDKEEPTRVSIASVDRSELEAMGRTERQLKRPAPPRLALVL